MDPLGSLAAVTVVTAALRVRDPHVHGSWGLCPSASLLHVYCPFCGSLRAVNDLTHGDVVAAASSNVLLVAAIPVALVLYVVWLRGAWAGRRPPTWLTSWPVLYAGLGVLALFTVLRNLPGNLPGNLPVGAWLAP